MELKKELNIWLKIVAMLCGILMLLSMLNFGVDKAFASETHTITYNANGGTFSNGTSENAVTYDFDSDIKRISKTSNVSEDGSSFSGDYPAAYENIDTVTIDGAMMLRVTVTYQTASKYSDYVCIYDNSVIPEKGNYAQSISNKLGGIAKKTETFIINGNTVHFLWTAEEYASYYGYYAVIEPIAMATSGAYEVPNLSNAKRFVGWYTDVGCTESNKFDIANETPTADVTVYAKYEDIIISYSGTCGGCSWSIDEDGCLEIYPTDGISGRLASSSWPWLNYKSVIKSVKIKQGVWGNTSCAGMFEKLRNCEKMDLSRLNTSDVTNMENMFNGCAELTSLDLSNFDTSNVTNMFCMFYWCDELEDLNISTWNTSNLKNMQGMFTGISVENLDLSHFNTSNVTNMDGVFTSAKIKRLDISSFNMSKVQHTSGMFSYFSEILEIVFPSNIIFAETEFDEINGSWIKLLDSNGNPTNDNTEYTSSEVTASIKLAGTWVRKVPQAVFSKDDNSLTIVVDLPIAEGTVYNGKNVTDVFVIDLNESYTYSTGIPWYKRAVEIRKVVVEDTIKPVSTSNFFHGMYNCVEMDLRKLDTSAVKSMSSMFSDCRALIDLDLSSFDTSNVTDMGSMFSNCLRLTELDLSSFDTSNVTDMSYMFSNCSSFAELDVSNFDTRNVTSMDYMFSKCEALTTLNLSNFNTSKVTNMSNMFINSSSLVSLDLSNFDTSNVTDMSAMFSGCSSLAELDTSNFDTSKVTNMKEMFNGCSSLTSLDLSSFNTALVTGMKSMFNNCKGLTSLDLSNFDTALVTDMGYMFYGCDNLRTLNIGSFDTSSVRTSGMSYMFYQLKNLRKITFSDKFAIVSGHYFVGSSVGDNWVKIRELDGTKLYDKTEYTANDVALMTKETPSRAAGTWARYGIEEDYITNEDGTVEFISSDNNWVMQSNTVWTYVFPVFDDTLIYYLFEELMDGYSSVAMMPYYIEVKDKMATIVNTKSEEAVATGSLLITKEVEGVETNEKFEITITLIGEGINGKQVFNDIIFDNGISKVSLKDGESILFDEFPVGTRYSITEKNYIEYASEILNETGTIEENSTKNVIVVNTYIDTPTIEPEEKAVNITLVKKIDGNVEAEQDFLISLYMTGLKSNTTYYMSNGEYFTSDFSGAAFYNIQISANENIVIQNIPVGAKYQFIEEAGEYTASYKIMDGNSEVESNSNLVANKSLATQSKEVLGNEQLTVTFINAFTTVQNLTISKAVKEEQEDGTYINYETDDSFEFNIKFSNMKEGESFSSDIGRVVSDEYGEAYKTFYLKNGESVSFYDLPVNTKYIVEETANSDYVPSYLVTGLEVAKSGKTESNKNKSLSTEIETIQADEIGNVVFTNIVPLTGKLVVSKKVEGTNDFSESFEFIVRLSGDNISDHETFSDVEFVNGIGKIYLKAGESKEFELPVGTSYEVEETEHENYETNYKAERVDAQNMTLASDISSTSENIIGIEGVISKNIYDIVTVTNTYVVSETEVDILKVDNKNNPLVGATLQIIDIDGNVVDEWVSTTDEHKVNLTYGTYTLHEVKAPNGYKLADDIEFNVVEGEENLVTMVDLKVEELPATGGTGTMITIALATIFASIAGMLIYVGKKKSSKERE